MVTSDFAALNNMRLKLILAAAVTICVAQSSIVHAATKNSPPTVFDTQERWHDQDGKQLQWRDSKINWTVLSMIYTSCQSSCPLITQKMKYLQSKLAPEVAKGVRFFLFSFDPAHDTQSVLKSFASKNHLDSTYWKLFQSSEANARELAAVLDFKFRKLSNGDFTHSNQITLLNIQGVIVKQASTDDDLTKAFSQLF